MNRDDGKPEFRPNNSQWECQVRAGIVTRLRENDEAKSFRQTEGKVLTDRLLAGTPEDKGCGTDSLERPGLRIELSIVDEPSWILMPSSEFRAVLFELVTNATKAGARLIRIRLARHGCRIWLIVTDDGSGFEPASALSAAAPFGLHGTGLGRLVTAADAARGKIRVKSKPGWGSAAALVLPIIRLISTPTREAVDFVERLLEPTNGQRSAC